MKRIYSLLMISLCLLPNFLLAQKEKNAFWVATISTINKQEIKGYINQWNDSQLIVSRLIKKNSSTPDVLAEKPDTIHYSQIRVLRLEPRRSKGNPVFAGGVIGTIAGAGLGAGLTYPSSQSTNSDPCFSACSQAILITGITVGGVIGCPVGAGIGAVIKNSKGKFQVSGDAIKFTAARNYYLVKSQYNRRT
jgi:outer membrane lipoprotein SlyB